MQNTKCNIPDPIVFMTLPVNTSNLLYYDVLDLLIQSCILRGIVGLSWVCRFNLH
jgi:hypothetical protein